MGIRGLSTFFDKNPDLLESYELHNTEVVIDGNNLLHFLYFSNHVPCTYGGDYDRYASVIRNYFASYLQCRIKPIVIFDGGNDRSDRKLQTIIERKISRLKLVDRIASQESYSEDVLPVFASAVFLDILKEMNIAHAQSSFEADGPISWIANHYHCPVVSQDSDFYIFDLNSGFIRSDSIVTTVMVGRTGKGRLYSFLNCKIYYVNNFLSFFPGLEKHILPLFSTLFGNDFIDVSTFEDFFLSDEFPTRNEFSKKLIVHERHQRLVGLLEWLRTCQSVDDAIDDILRYLPKRRRRPVRKLIRQAVDVYKVRECNLLSYLGQVPRDFCGSVDVLDTFSGNSLPAWFLDDFHRARLPSQVANIVGLRRMILPTQVEDTTLSSTHICSMGIRQVFYGLLASLDSSFEHTFPRIEEYDRAKKSLQRKLVGPTTSLRRYGPLPKLSTSQLDVEDAKRLISYTLGEQQTCLRDLPDFLQLLVMCIRYWLKTCLPHPTVSFLDALLLTTVYLTVAEPLVPEHSKTMDRCSVHYGKLSRSAFNNTSVIDLMKMVTSSNATYYWKKINKYFQPPLHHGGNPVAISIVHSYTQLQSCLFYTMYLNAVTGRPFLTSKIQCTFSGTLIYNLTEELQAQRKLRNPDDFLSDMLGPYSALDCLFKKLRSKILQNLPAVCLDRAILTSGSNGNKKR